MTSTADIVASMRSLNLGSSPKPYDPNIKTTKLNPKANDFKPTMKLDPARINPLIVPKGPSKAEPSKFRSPKSQRANPKAYPVYNPSELQPKLINKADGSKAYQFKTKTELDTLPISPKNTRRSPRNRIKASNLAPVAAQHPSSSQRLSTPGSIQPQPVSSQLERAQKPLQQSFKYVVQTSTDSENSESIVGVYNKLERANECAEECVRRWGIKKSEIVDIQSSLGCKAKARRRKWQGGMSEIIVGGKWVKIFPQKISTSEKEDKDVYLALDRSAGLFIIGVFTQKGLAWEACKKYRDQLAYCSDMAGTEQWFDEEGMFHLKGKIAGMVHHWFVIQYPVDGKV